MSKLSQEDGARGFAPGSVIDNRYKVVRCIGEGGNGLVHEVEHVRTGRRLALKTLIDETGFARLEQEARATSLLRNEHAARITDMGSAGAAGPYLVMEMLDGQSLRALLDDAGQLPLELTVNIALQVCECLAEAHAHGIVHRDLKPENVFLSPSPWPGQYDVKVLDFGVVKIASDGPIPNSSLTRTGSTVGTPYYMSLEQLRNSSNVDARADVYSLGVVLYESLCGRKPFQADTIGDLVYALCSGPPTHLGRLRPDLPADVCEVLMRSLHVNRDERPATMIDLAAALLGHGNSAFGLWVKVDGKRPALAPARPGSGLATPSSIKVMAPTERAAFPSSGNPPLGPVSPGPFAPTPSVRARPSGPEVDQGNGAPPAPSRPAPWAEPFSPAPSLALPAGEAADAEEVDVEDQPPARRDTPTEMFLKGAHPEPPQASDRDTPTRAFRADAAPAEMVSPAKRAHFLETLKSPAGMVNDESTPETLERDRPAELEDPPTPAAALADAGPPALVGLSPHGTLPLRPRGASGFALTSSTSLLAHQGPPSSVMPPSGIPSGQDPGAPVHGGFGGAMQGPRSPSLTEAVPRPVMLATSRLDPARELITTTSLTRRPPPPPWQQALDGALIRVGRFVEGLVRSFRSAPPRTQLLLAAAVGLPLLVFASSVFYLLLRG